ncbi:hypothetical protein [Gordonia sp. NPDC003422]
MSQDDSQAPRKTLLHGPLFSRNKPLDRESAAARISAYIYGNILILAAIIPIDPEREKFGVLVLLGTAASTFLAHVFAETLGRQVLDGSEHTTPRSVLHHLRNSVPILTSAVLPCLILVAGLLDWLEPRTAQLVAEVVILARIAGTVFVIDRLNGERPSRATLGGAIAVLILATAVVGIKVILTH